MPNEGFLEQGSSTVGSTYWGYFLALGERPVVRVEEDFALWDCLVVPLLIVSRTPFRMSFFAFNGRFRAGELSAAVTALVVFVADTRLRDLGGEVEAFFALVLLVCAGARTRLVIFAFTFVAFIVGNLILRFDFVDVCFEAFVDFLDALFLDNVAAAGFFRETAALETATRAFDAAFLTPDLMEDGARALPFLLLRGRDLFRAFSFLRFAAFAFFASAISFSLAALNSARCSFSLFRGPKIPRHLDEPHRHCWTFFCEYGLG